MTLSVTEDNNVLINFSDKISRDLLPSDIDLEVIGPRDGGYEYTWELVEVEQGMGYEIVISFVHDDIPEGTTLKVGVTSSDITDVND